MDDSNRNAGERAAAGFDAYSPAQMAARARSAGVVKAKLALGSASLLGVMAGAFIAIGSLYYTIIVADPTLGFAATRVLGGVVFSVGLVLVIVAGGELFTGNNLLAMAWAEGAVSTRLLARNWTVALVANAFGAASIALLVTLTPYAAMNGGSVGTAAVRIAVAKVSLSFSEAFFAGILCNLLVCMAVWLTLAGRSVMDKVVAIVFPISAFVAAGFEHSVANMYFIPLGIFVRDSIDAAAVAGIERLDWSGYLRNLVPVTLGNIVGGSGLVGLAYYVIYGRRARTAVTADAAPECAMQRDASLR